MSEYKFKMTVGTYEQMLDLKNGSEIVQVPLVYPTIKESESFWKIIDLIMKNPKDKDDKDKEEMLLKLIPYIEDYVAWSIEKKQNSKLTEQERKGLSVLLLQNMEVVVSGLEKLITNILPQDFQKATPNQHQEQ